MQPPELNVIVLVVIVVLTVAIGGWYFLLRGSGQQSEFLRAHDRFVAAEHDAEAAMAKVTRFIELEEFDATVLAQIKVMEHQAAVFKRLAGEGDDEEARLADKAAGGERPGHHRDEGILLRSPAPASAARPGCGCGGGHAGGHRRARRPGHRVEQPPMIDKSAPSTNTTN